MKIMEKQYLQRLLLRLTVPSYLDDTIVIVEGQSLTANYSFVEMQSAKKSFFLNDRNDAMESSVHNNNENDSL